MAFPNSPRAVLDGHFAEASIGGTLIALLFEWEATIDTDTTDLTAHGDVWKVTAALDSGWRFRARGYVVPASVNTKINDLYTSGALPVTITVAGYSGSVASGTKIFEGTGIPTRCNLSAPMALAEQEFEVIGTGTPTVGV